MKKYESSELKKKKNEAEELVQILAKIPKEKKTEAIGIIKGFALCAESDCQVKAAV